MFFFDLIASSDVASLALPDKTFIDKIFHELREIKPPRIVTTKLKHGYETNFSYSKFRYVPSGLVLLRKAVCKSALEVSYWAIQLSPVNKRKRIVLKAGRKTFIGYDSPKDLGLHAYLNQELFFQACGMADNSSILLAEANDGTWYVLFELPGGSVYVFDTELAIVLGIFEEGRHIQVIVPEKFRAQLGTKLVSLFADLISKGVCVSRICKNDILFAGNSEMLLDFTSFGFHGLDRKANLAYAIGKLAAEGLIDIKSLEGVFYSGFSFDTEFIEQIRKSSLVCTQLLLERRLGHHSGKNRNHAG